MLRRSRSLTIVAIPLLFTCDSGKVSEEQAMANAERVAKQATTDVAEIRRGLPPGAKKLAEQLATDVGDMVPTRARTISLVLRLVGLDPDPARSREHVLLSVLAEHRLLAGGSADLALLLEDLDAPPVERAGALPLDRFLPKKHRRELAASLNTLLASPSFASRHGSGKLSMTSTI